MRAHNIEKTEMSRSGRSSTGKGASGAQPSRGTGEDQYLDTNTPAVDTLSGFMSGLVAASVRCLPFVPLVTSLHLVVQFYLNWQNVRLWNQYEPSGVNIWRVWSKSGFHNNVSCRAIIVHSRNPHGIFNFMDWFVFWIASSDGCWANQSILFYNFYPILLFLPFGLLDTQKTVLCKRNLLQILQSSQDLEIFDGLEEKGAPWSAEKLAKKKGYHVGATERLLNTLTSMKLVLKDSKPC